mmetsp:Transcript_20025/g.27725  ORF Transcript_20025/g.27725 Transcript_20025/m.27725 type:complete len:156 (+) Transcript_20025:201-668(+)
MPSLHLLVKQTPSFTNLVGTPTITRDPEKSTRLSFSSDASDVENLKSEFREQNLSPSDHVEDFSSSIPNSFAIDAHFCDTVEDFPMVSSKVFEDLNSEQPFNLKKLDKTNHSVTIEAERDEKVSINPCFSGANIQKQNKLPPNVVVAQASPIFFI